MANANDIQAVVFKNGSATLLARVVGADGSAITQATISAAEYSVYLIDEYDPDSLTVVSGHEAAELTVASVIFDTLQTDAIWDVDSTGYNFKHVLDVLTNQAFLVAGRDYLVVVTLTPTSGQDILVRFRCKVI